MLIQALERKKQDSEGVEKDIVELVLTLENFKPIQILKDQFLSLFEKKDLEINIATVFQTELSTSATPFSKTVKSLEPFKEYLKKNHNIDLASFLNDIEDDLIIRSTLEVFLNLPWENFFENKEKNIAIFREVAKSPATDQLEAVNFILLLSHAFINGDGSKKNPIDIEISEESNGLINELISNNKPPFKAKLINIVKHTTHVKLKNEISWENFNVAHFILHGENDGELCFENEDNHEFIQLINSSELTEFIAHKLGQDKKYSLFYLSCCNSGLNANNFSISFDLVNKEITNYVLAYYGSVKSKKASAFAIRFYCKLVLGNGIRKSFKEALKDCKVYDRLDPKFIPVMYCLPQNI